MRILLLSEIFPPKIGGSGRWLWELYRRLPRESYVIAAGQDPGQEAFDATHDLRVNRVPLSFPTRFLRPSSLPAYRKAFGQLRRIVRQDDVHWVHASRSVPEGLLALMLKWTNSVPYLCYAHGEEVNLSNAEEDPGWLQRRVYGSRELALMVGLVLRNASLMIVNSQNTGEILTRCWQLPAAKVRIMSPGVDVERFRPAPPDAVFREARGWNGRSVLITVGRLQKRKGHDVLISALPEIRRKIPNVLCAVVGSGEERATLERLVEENALERHVQFLGEVDDNELIRCYQQCDLFVLPNRRIGGDIEGFGIVLLEAQACGKPVVAGDSGGTRETMQIPETGLVVPCDTPKELASVVSELLADNVRLGRMGRAAREWILAEYDWEARRRKADALFREAMFKTVEI